MVKVTNFSQASGDPSVEVKTVFEGQETQDTQHLLLVSLNILYAYRADHQTSLRNVRCQSHCRRRRTRPFLR